MVVLKDEKWTLRFQQGMEEVVRICYHSAGLSSREVPAAAIASMALRLSN